MPPPSPSSPKIGTADEAAQRARSAAAARAREAYNDLERDQRIMMSAAPHEAPAHGAGAQAQQLRVFDQRLAKEHAAADVVELEAARLRASRASPPAQQRQVSPPSPQKELPGLEQRASALLKQDVERAKRAVEHRSAVNEELARLRREEEIAQLQASVHSSTAREQRTRHELDDRVRGLTEERARKGQAQQALVRAQSAGPGRTARSPLRTRGGGAASMQEGVKGADHRSEEEKLAGYARDRAAAKKRRDDAEKREGERRAVDEKEKKQEEAKKREENKRNFMGWLGAKEKLREQQAEMVRQREKEKADKVAAEQKRAAASKEQARREAEKEQAGARQRWSVVAAVRAKQRQEALDLQREEEDIIAAEREEREWRRAVERQHRETEARKDRMRAKREARDREVRLAAQEAAQEAELLTMRQLAEKEWSEAAAAAYAARAPLPKRPAHMAFETPAQTAERRLADDRARAAGRVRVRQDEARRLRMAEEAAERQAAVLRQVEAAERVRERQKHDAMRREQAERARRESAERVRLEAIAASERAEWERAENEAWREAQGRIQQRTDEATKRAEIMMRAKQLADQREQEREMTTEVDRRREAGGSEPKHVIGLRGAQDEAAREAERVERERILDKVRKDAEQKARKEWAATEDRVRREAEEAGKRKAEEKVKRDAAAAARRTAAESVELDPQRQLWAAAHAGDAVRLRGLLRTTETPLRSMSWPDSTPLHAAASAGHEVCCEMLTLAGCQVDAKNPGGRTALHAACMLGHVDCAAQLLRAGAVIETTDYWGNTPLIAAANEGHTRCVQLCIEHGAQVHTRGQHGSALEVGRAGGHDEVCDLLVQHAAVVRAGAATR